MIYVSRISLILLATALFAFNAFSQATKLTEKDLNSIISNATSASNRLPRREKALTETFKDKTLPDSDIIIFTETFLPPDKSQTFYSHETAKGKSVYETITVGSVVYEKTEGEPWRIRTAEDMAALPPPPMKAPPPSVVDKSVSVNKKSNIKLGKSVTDFYEMEKITTRTNKNGSVARTEVNRYWINKNGTLAKSQTEYFGSDYPMLSRRTVIYEYDPTIKIEAPIK